MCHVEKKNNMQDFKRQGFTARDSHCKLLRKNLLENDEKKVGIF